MQFRLSIGFAYLSNIRTLLSLDDSSSNKKTYKVHEEWEREQARRRQEATRAQPGQQVGQVREIFPAPDDTGRARDAIGAELGMSDFHY